MKKVFISHSSVDAEIAMKLCKLLEKNGISCWIAPRDIDYGEKWAAEIAGSLINDTLLFVFILSENSNKSNQVLKEINIALNHNITMLAITIENVKKLNLSLEYYLTNIHTCFCTDDDKEKNVAAMTAIVMKSYNRALGGSNAASADSSTKKRISETDMGKYLSEKFDELFGTDEDTDTEGKDSPIRKKLYGIIWNNLITGRDEPIDLGLDEDEEENKDEEDEAVTEYDEFDPFCTRGSPKYFTLIEKQDCFTMIYQVNKMIHPNTHKKYFRAVCLDDMTKKLDDGTIEHTFFLDEPSIEGNPLVVIAIDETKGLIFFSTGFIDNENIGISNNPTVMEMKSAVKDSAQIIQFVYSSMDPTICILDTLEKKPVYPYTKYNEDTEEEETHIDLKSGRRYLAFKISARKRLTFNIPLDDQNNGATAPKYYVGYGHYKGEYGLKKNWLLAAEQFMQSNDPRAYYYLGVIFLKDPLLYDKELAREYIEKALGNGIEQAQKLRELLESTDD